MHFLIHVLVFGIALTFSTRVVSGVRVEPRSALPLVALVFALLNAFLYTFLVVTTKVLSLYLLYFAAPFIANAVLLWLTDKLSKPFRIDGLGALAGTSLIMTLAHVILRLAGI